MGYADDLYDIENVKGILVNRNGRVLAAFVQNDQSFGFIHGSGRRIAMNSADHKLQVLPSGFQEMIGKHVILNNSKLRSTSTPSFRAVGCYQMTRQILSDCNNLFHNNQDLASDQNLLFAKALFDYSQKSSHKADDVIGKAAYQHLQKSRPNTVQDRYSAKNEYDSLPPQYRAEARGRILSEDDVEDVPTVGAVSMSYASNFDAFVNPVNRPTHQPTVLPSPKNRSGTLATTVRGTANRSGSSHRRQSQGPNPRTSPFLNPRWRFPR